MNETDLYVIGAIVGACVLWWIFGGFIERRDRREP